MNEFPKVYNIIWSILAIFGGALLLLFREKFIKACIRIFQSWYRKTHFGVFKSQAENFDSTYMRMVIVLVGTIFIAAGIITILGSK